MTDDILSDLQELVAVRGHYHGVHIRAIAEIERLRSEVERLKRELENLQPVCVGH